MKRLFVILFFAVSYLSLFAQNEVQVCLRDGSVQTFKRSEIQSISYSDTDVDGIVHNKIVSQEIHVAKDFVVARDTVVAGVTVVERDTIVTRETVRFPLSEIERVDFVKVLCPDDNHPHAIDLGIGVKWACCNVDASKPEGYGGFYAWGETKEDVYYWWSSYQYYIMETGDVVNIGENISGTDYDVAHVNWGDKWRMPTVEETKKLVDNCSSEWTQVNGINGRRFTGPNGNSIFLPATGSRWEVYHFQEGVRGGYWTATLIPDNPDDISADFSDAYCLTIDSDDNGVSGNAGGPRCSGATVRPVSDQ